MKIPIVSNGLEHHKSSAEFRLQLRKVKQEINDRYRVRLEKSNFLMRLWIRFQMFREFNRKKTQLEPSSQALYLGTVKY